MIAVLHGLAQTEAIKDEVVQEAIARFDIDADRDDPRLEPEPVSDACRSDGAALVFLEGVVVEGVVVPLVVELVVVFVLGVGVEVDVGEGAEPSRNRPSSKPCFSSRASRNRRARPFLGTWSPALQEQRTVALRCPTGPGCPFILPQPEPRRVQFAGTTAYRNGRFP